MIRNMGDILVTFKNKFENFKKGNISVTYDQKQ